MKISTLKCVIWDLDNTLWHGTLPEGGAIEPRPEALELIRRLDGAGIVQSVVSKNDYDDAKQALTNLGLFDCFVYPQISWSAKSASVEQIVDLLNMGKIRWWSWTTRSSKEQRWLLVILQWAATPCRNSWRPTLGTS